MSIITGEKVRTKTLQVTGSAYVGTRNHSRWYDASAFKLPTTAPAAAGELGSLGTLVFADSTADDNAWLTFVPPAGIDYTADALMYLYYVLPSGTPTEGAWNFLAANIADEAAANVDSAVALDDILDLPSAANALNITASTTIGAALLVLNQPTNIIVSHDYTDPFGGEVHLLGVRIDFPSIAV